MITFSNPRLKAVFNDWPLGGNKRGPCTFEVHFDPKRGYRVSRTTTGKPKYNTYGDLAAIVDGSDGKTYILQASPPTYGKSISISRSDFMNPDPKDLGHDHFVKLWDTSTDEEKELYKKLMSLIEQANKPAP